MEPSGLHLPVGQFQDTLRSSFKIFSSSETFKSLQVFGLRDVKLVYVESIARVKKLSLTGLIFYKLGLMDEIFVQWPSLCTSYPRTKYVGRLM